MKILYVDINNKGHHVPYMSALNAITEDSMFYLPYYAPDIPMERQVYRKYDYKDFWGYINWLFDVRNYALENNIDTIHFLFGDVFYRFFGIGLSWFKKFKIITTFHHFRKSKLHDISLRNIFRQIQMGVVHTSELKTYVQKQGIHNVCVVTYPVFENIQREDKWKSCEKLSIGAEVPTLLCFGGTRKDKGLDILLDALKYISTPVQVVVAGKPDFFTEEFISDRLKALNIAYHLSLTYIDEAEIGTFFSAADYVVLPYRRIFDGASGPLGIACCLKKTIIGPDHGSLGQIISENHLGFTFEAENSSSLAQAIQNAVESNFCYDEVAQKYIKQLDVNTFQKAYARLYNELQNNS